MYGYISSISTRYITLYWPRVLVVLFYISLVHLWIIIGKIMWIIDKTLYFDQYFVKYVLCWTTHYVLSWVLLSRSFIFGDLRGRFYHHRPRSSKYHLYTLQQFMTYLKLYHPCLKRLLQTTYYTFVLFRSYWKSNPTLFNLLISMETDSIFSFYSSLIPHPRP